MKTETVAYRLGEQVFRGYLAFDDRKSGKRPGVLVVHEAWGLDDHNKRQAERIAELGYVGFAVDMLGDGKVVSGKEGLMETRALRADLDALRGRIRAAFDTLAARPEVDAARMGLIGFCFGGTTSLELARSGAPVAGVVSFHGGLETERPAQAGTVKAKVLVATGADDPYVPPAHVEGFVKEMTGAGVDFQVIVYGGAKHGFTNPAADTRGLDGLGYNKVVDRRSWEAMTAFFREIFAL